jgi:beta-galactosidase
MTINRRSFLKTSALATAAAWAAPLLLGTSDVSEITKNRLSDGWEHYRGPLSGPWEVWHGARSGEGGLWSNIAMPHCFNAFDAVDPDTTYYRGQGWYRTQLAVHNPFPNGRTLLQFEGCGQKTRVYVGEEQVAEHIGGYDEWFADITAASAKALADAKNKGKVPLAIVCDNSRDVELAPSDFSDFNLYGGLYRYVNLACVPEVSPERFLITSQLQAGGSAQVSVRCRLYNPSSSRTAITMSIQVRGPRGDRVHDFEQTLTPWTGEREVMSFRIEKPELWSPSRPLLYGAAVAMHLTPQSGYYIPPERFGIRHYESAEHGPFKLNGERLMLRGTQRHEDHAGLGSAMTDDLIRQELKLVKEMGANFIRLGHYQQTRIVLDCCDELGIMVWEEIPWCRSGIAGERWQAQVRRMLHNMIDQHYNHPSVIVWGLGNENDWPGEYPSEDREAIRGFLTSLRDSAHAQDATRVTGIRRCNFAKDIPDVYSPSIWAGWYRGRYTEYKASVLEEMAKVPRFLHVEWGGDSHARRHSEDPDKVLNRIATGQGTDERGLDYLLTGGIERASRDGDWSETYICNLFDWHLREQETIPNFTGSAQWIFKDFSTPERPENPIPYVNQKGVTERDLTLKEGYFVFQSYWTEKPMVHIYGHSWPVRWGAVGEPRMVKVYSNCETVELFLDGQSLGLKKRNSQDFPAAGLRWSVVYRPGENHLRAVGRRGQTSVEDSIVQSYESEKWEAPTQLRLRELSRDGDKVTVEAALLDANGRLCLDARNRVRFGCAGDGRLIENLGTNRGSRVVELSNGRALISLLRNGGKSEVSVSAKGIPAMLLAVS